jgi:peptidoglycan/xylan/chitin deacetylase (PgdA/CDA1 family)
MARRGALLVPLTALAVTTGLALAGGDDAPIRVDPLADVALESRLGELPQREIARVGIAEDRAITRLLRRNGWVSHGGGHRRMIALTFDDGPSPDTPAVLRVLTAHHAPATFFIVGNMARNRLGTLAATARGGFVIADHTVNHPFLAGRRARDQRGEIAGVSRLITRHGLDRPRLFRPPYGSFDRTTRQVLRSARMLMVLWSVDPGDYLRPGAKQIAERVLSAAKPGAIVLMHDGGGAREQTVAALPRIINGLRRRGYSLVTVPALLRYDPAPRRQPRLPRPGPG